MAHQWHSQLLGALGRGTEAVAEIKRAAELDPLSLVLSGIGPANAGGQYDLAIEISRKKLELDPNYPSAYAALGAAYSNKGMYQEAIANKQKAVDLSGGDPEYLTQLAGTYAKFGKRKEALKILHQLTLLSKRRYVSPVAIARV
jgi:tetratricopeptide (TPR) repeat protein